MTSKIPLSTAAILLLICCCGFSQNVRIQSAAPSEQYFAISGEHTVYRISRTNEIAKLAVPVQALMESEYGSFGPLVSPDQRWIAYVNEYDIWVLDTETTKKKRLTGVGYGYGKRYASVEPLILSWSPDSREILFHLTPGEVVCADCDRPDWDVRPGIAYGYYRLELGDHSVHKLSIPETFKFRAWLPDGRILGVVRKGDRCGEDFPSGCGILVAWRPDSTLKPVSTHFGDFGQFSPSIDGSFAVLGGHNPAWSDQSQILKIDLSTGVTSEISANGGYAEYQWPKLSRDAKHISWTRAYRSTPGNKVRGRVIVDGAVVVACGDFPRFQWLDNERLAGTCDGYLLIVDRSGHELGKTLLPKGDSSLAHE